MKSKKLIGALVDLGQPENSMIEEFKNIWTEKYRPHTLDDLIINDRVKRTINNFVKEKEIPNLLFVGSPGTGKTSCARIIVKDLLKCDYLYINASDENGIDAIRTKVVGFAQTKSFDGGVKVVILDEQDAMTISAQAALRNTMETFAKYTRFILTANYKHKIIPALQSRCQFLEIKPDLKQTVKRCCEILAKENVLVKGDQKSKLIKLIKLKFPDIRLIINELQKNTIDNELLILNIAVNNKILDKALQSIVNKDVLGLRKYLIENEEEFQGDYDNLLTEFLNYLYDQNLDPVKKKQMIAIIADHLYKSAFVFDKEINATACWINLEQI